MKNRQTITESAVILGREKEMVLFFFLWSFFSLSLSNFKLIIIITNNNDTKIYAKKRPSNDLAPTYMVLKNGDPCPYNSSIPMSVVVCFSFFIFFSIFIVFNWYLYSPRFMSDAKNQKQLNPLYM